MNAIKFRCVTTYDLPTLYTLSKIGAAVKSRWKSLAWRLVGLVIAAYMLFMGTLSLFSLSGMEIFGVIYLLCGAAAGIWSLFLYRIRAWYVRRFFMNGTQKQTFLFDEEGFEIAVEGAEKRIRDEYGEVLRLVETGDYFLLFLEKNVAHILPKGTLTGGTPEEFRKFLEEKSGRAAEEMRG